MSTLAAVSETDGDIAAAWARVEAALATTLPAALPHLAPPAGEAQIDALEAALGVTLPADFRAGLRRHNGTVWGRPSPVPLEQLYDTDGIVAATREWRDSGEPDPEWDDPSVWAWQIDENLIRVNGPVRPTLDPAGRIVLGTMNGDVHWLLDLDPPPGGTPGQVVRIDPECQQWDVLAPSWTHLLHRYAADLENAAVAIVPEVGPECEWGTTSGERVTRPDWLRDVEAREPA
jgi:cell wall assembly regulator SMI1